MKVSRRQFTFGGVASIVGIRKATSEANAPVVFVARQCQSKIKINEDLLADVYFDLQEALLATMGPRGKFTVS